MRIGAFQQVAEVARMRRTGRLRFVRVDQALARIRLHGLQQPVPHLGSRAARYRLHQRLAHQRGDRVQNILHGDAVACADALDRIQRRTTGEDRHPLQQRPFRLVEQLPAPFHDGTQRLVPAQRCPATVGEQPEPVIQPAGDLLRGQHTHARRGELDRQRHAIESLADLHDRPGRPLVDPETRTDRGGSFGEQPDGGVRVRLLGSCHRAVGR